MVFDGKYYLNEETFQIKLWKFFYSDNACKTVKMNITYGQGRKYRAIFS